MGKITGIVWAVAGLLEAWVDARAGRSDATMIEFVGLLFLPIFRVHSRRLVTFAHLDAIQGCLLRKYRWR